MIKYFFYHKSKPNNIAGFKPILLAKLYSNTLKI